MMYAIECVSSLNLRVGRAEEDRKLKEAFGFSCSFCQRKRQLGRSSPAMSRVMFRCGKESENVVMCERCMDVFVDLVRNGPRVLQKAYKWRLMSRVVRLSIVEGEMSCSRCFGRADSHIFVKFDNLMLPGEAAQYSNMRVCARCAVSYFKMMQKEIDAMRERFVPMDSGKGDDVLGMFVGYHRAMVAR